MLSSPQHIALVCCISSLTCVIACMYLYVSFTSGKFYCLLRKLEMYVPLLIFWLISHFLSVIFLLIRSQYSAFSHPVPVCSFFSSLFLSNIFIIFLCSKILSDERAGLLHRLPHRFWRHVCVVPHTARMQGQSIHVKG